MATLAQILCNVHNTKKGKTFSPFDFLPRYMKKRQAKRQTTKQMLGFMSAWTSAHNETVRK